MPPFGSGTGGKGWRSATLRGGLRSQASFGVSPLTIAGAATAIWLRADLGITIATGVSQWKDQSGNGNHFLQATGANQPAYSASGGANGTAYASSPGVGGGTQMDCAGWASQAQPFEYFVVCNSGGLGAGNNQYLIDFGAGATDQLVRFVGSSTMYLYGAVGATITTGADMILGCQLSGNSSSMILNGGAPTATFGGSGATGVGATIFNNVSGGSSWWGRLYEYIVINRLCTTAERLAMTRYLGARYAITVP